MSTIRPARVLAAVISLFAAVAVCSAAPAQAASTIVGSTGSCTLSKGALVAVDYKQWSGPVARGCSTSLSNGRALLTSAGFTLTDVSRQPGFICRIGSPLFNNGTQYPTSAEQACVVTPPASAYWSYWYAKKGVNTWTYSSTGASGNTPAAGEVQAWTFGSTDIDGTTGQPVFTPNQIRAGMSA